MFFVGVIGTCATPLKYGKIVKIFSTLLRFVVLIIHTKSAAVINRDLHDFCFTQIP